MIRIITDSTSDISRERAEELGIDIVPLGVIFGEETFLDGVTISAKEFYDKLQTVTKLPKTSQVTPYQFETLFRKYIDQGDEIIGIFISHKMSGTYQSAVIASDICPERIHIIDSMNVTVCLGLLVEEAVKLKNKELTAQEIVEKIENIKDKLRLFAVVDTLKYLQMGGRISSTSALVGNLLDINPIIGIYDGFVESVAKTRGKKAAYRWIEKKVQEEVINNEYPVRFANSNSPELMKDFINFISEKIQITESTIAEIGPVVGTHAGPGAVCIAYFTK